MPAAEVLEYLKLRHGAREFALGAEVPRESLPEVLRVLRDGFGYRFYVVGTATDRPTEIEVIHGVRNLDTHDEMFLKTHLPREAPEVDSAALVFPGAEWHEREMFDLFGIRFRSHPDPRRILLPDDYEGHPLRKDFPIDAAWGYRPPTRSEAT
jgi:NADH-quinone oxidoreductase subunit C